MFSITYNYFLFY